MEGILASGAIIHLGLQDGPEPDTLIMDVGPKQATVWQTAHTYVVAALIEMAGAKVSPVDVVPCHVDFQIIRPIPLGARAIARGFVVNAGRSMVYTRTEVHVDGKLAAQGSVTFKVVEAVRPA